MDRGLVEGKDNDRVRQKLMPSPYSNIGNSGGGALRIIIIYLCWLVALDDQTNPSIFRVVIDQGCRFLFLFYTVIVAATTASNVQYYKIIYYCIIIFFVTNKKYIHTISINEKKVTHSL